MSRKHFKDLADELRSRKPSACEWPETTGPLTKEQTREHREQEIFDRARLSQWAEDVQGVARICSWHNNNFDRDRFYRAAGLIE